MKRLKIEKLFATVVGENCDFLRTGLDQACTLKVLHFWSVQVTKFCGTPHFTIDELGVMFVEGSKFMFPRTSADCPWLIQRLSPDAELRMKLIHTDMRPSVIYKDLSPNAAPAPPPMKKPKKGAPALPPMMLSQSVDMGSKKGTRPTEWADDVHALIDNATSQFNEGVPDHERAIVKDLPPTHSYSIFLPPYFPILLRELVWRVSLRFCFKGEDMVVRTTFSKWFQLRAHLCTLVSTSAIQAQISNTGKGAEQQAVSRTLMATLTKVTGVE
eukprot:9501862-Pyramimonas_sp.AAC.1